MGGIDWLAGEIALNDELAEGRWLEPDALSALKTTDGLADIVATAAGVIAASR